MSVAVRLSKVVAALTDCLCEGLTQHGAGPTCWCGLFPGTEVAWDYCGECSSRKCGMGYVRIVSVYESDSFPTPNPDQSRCGSPLAVQLAVGALRCLPTMEQDGSLPDEAAMLEAGLAVIADMGAMREALRCCDVDELVIGAYTPLGARGGCVGGEWSVWVAL
jgi:hypothetical protein